MHTGSCSKRALPTICRIRIRTKWLADYEKNQRKVDAFRIPNAQQKKLAARLEPVETNLKNTHSGKIIKYIPRGSWFNSTNYDNALAAISTVKRNAGNLSADETYKNVETVLKYLNGKESVRKREFGRVRWNECMTFLKQTMPPKKFKEYCDYVNTKRNVADNPAHADYVSPESFGSTNYKEACGEALDQIERGKGRGEDFATLIALRNMDPTQPVDKKQLTLAKQAVMDDPEFQELSKEENKMQLHDFVVNKNRKDYKTLAEDVKDKALEENLIIPS